MVCQAGGCGKEFLAPVRAQGGGRHSKFCSPACRSRDWARNNPEKRAVTLDRYESQAETVIAKATRNRKAKLNKYGVDQNWFDAQLSRQRGACLGCGAHITEETARIDHDHATGKVRGLLCDSCNWALGHAKDSPHILRRLMAYLHRDIDKRLIYVGGALKNNNICAVADRLRSAGYDAMDEWITPGPDADSFLHAYSRGRGLSYTETIRGRAVENILLFDRSFIDMSDAFVMVLPCGKSAHLELGYAAGRGIPTFILMEEEPDRFDVMPAMAGTVVRTVDELVDAIRNTI